MSQKKSVSIIPGQFPQTVYLSQGDVGREFVLELVDENGAYAVPAEATVKFAGTKPSGLGFTADVVMSSTTGGTRCIATITSTYDMTSEYGRFPAEVKITQGDDVLGTANVYLDIEKNPHPDNTYDGSVEELIPVITALVERAEAAVEKGKDAEAWAVGQREGVDVGEDDPTYHNNAKYYCEQTEASETAAADSAASALDSKTAAAGSAASANVAQTRAAASEANAEEAATRAEGAAASAAAVFTIAGDASFSVDEDNDLWLNITIN